MKYFINSLKNNTKIILKELLVVILSIILAGMFIIYHPLDTVAICISMFVIFAGLYVGYNEILDNCFKK